jgi:multidrug efflux pump
MLLADLSIKRPVLALMFTGAIIIFGFIAIDRLPVRELPAMDFPVAMATVVYPGAGPEVVDRDVVEPLMTEINTIPGIRRLESVSVDGAARIDVEFVLERDIDAAAQDLRERIARVRPTLPRRMEEPLVTKLDLDAQPVVWFALSSTRHSIVEITEYWDRVLRPRFERIDGVGQFLRAGARRFAVRVWLDAQALETHGVTVADVIAALRDQNVALPAGRIEGADREFPVTMTGRAASIPELGGLVVAHRDGAPVFLRDVAEIGAGAEDERATARLSILPGSIGRDALGVGVIKQTQANTVQVADAVVGLIDELSPTLPEGMSLVTAIDASIFVEQSIAELREAVIFGGLLTILVVFLFLGNGRATLIAALAIPTSVLGSFTAVYWLGYSINTFTMLGIVLVIGEVIDDAILVLENIYRHRQAGLGALEAARVGTREVGLAAIASSFTLIVVFAPLAFVEGLVGRMLAEFALTIAVSIAVSLIVALTLIPMLCGRYLRLSPAGAGRFAARAQRVAGAISDAYTGLLDAALRRRWLVVVSAIASFAVTVVLLGRLGTELSPAVDEGAFVAFVTAPEGSTPEYTDAELRRVESVLATFPEVESFLAITAPSFGGIVPKGNEALGLVRLKPLADRRDMRSQAEVMAELRRRLADLPGATVTVFARPGALSGSSGAPVQLTVMGPDSRALHQGAERLRRELAAVPGIVDVVGSLQLNKPQLRALPRAEEAAHLGVPLTDVADTLQAALSGAEVTQFERDGRSHPVVVQLEKRDRGLAEQAGTLEVRSRSGQMVPLSSVVDFREAGDLNEVRRYERTRIAYIEAQLDGKPLGDALAAADEIAARVLPPGVEMKPVGAAMGMDESLESLIFTFLLAVLATYMLLAGQFNHLGHPLAIMVAIPLGLFGAVAALWIWGSTMNLYSGIGILVLIGLVVKNSILLVDYTNQMRAGGMGREAAILAAGSVRVRPILMTAATSILAVLPAILGFGVGSETREPMVVAVLGGMSMSTLLTLVVVPISYAIMDDFGRWVGRSLRRLSGRAPS